MSPRFGRWMGPFFQEIMTVLYDVGQQKTERRGAGISLTKTFLLSVICRLTDFMARWGNGGMVC
ncbi:hypothetical protein [Burkholderia sp. Bp9031]|uniref:hypothetical protein n=1 Tax=Burkholderia sp. Bp9031 TaxID=2184566 RepID=UPI000F5E5E8D|nr:hypothetical protein [Burkholderia sp. Bp9031]